MLDKLQPVFRSLNAHDVRYLVIGGIAAALHGVPRATFDLDLLIEPTPDNAERLLKALREAGIVTAELTDPDSLLEHEISVFKDILRIDVQIQTPGIRFEDAWKNKVEVPYEGETILLVSKEDLIRSKKAAGRKVDLEDVAILENLR